MTVIVARVVKVTSPRETTGTPVVAGTIVSMAVGEVVMIAPPPVEVSAVVVDAPVTAALVDAPAPVGDLELTLEWDAAGGAVGVDMDVAAVAFDAAGALVDAAYYNQHTALDGALAHSADVAPDAFAPGRMAETIRVDVGKLGGGGAAAAAADAIVFVISCYKGGTFKDVETATARLAEVGADGARAPLVESAVGCQGAHTSLCFAALSRARGGGGGWHYTSLGEPCGGHHFHDCLAAQRELLASRGLLDRATMREWSLGMDKTLRMTKGDYAVLPVGARTATVGLGWRSAAGCDLDTSLVAARRRPGAGGGGAVEIRGTCYFKNTALYGGAVRHTGDEQSDGTAATAGDNEAIAIELARVPAEATALYAVVNVYDQAHTLSEVAESYVRLVVDGRELARYDLGAKMSDRGLVYCRLVRCFTLDGAGWAFEALGLSCGGQCAFDVEMTDAIKGVPGVPVVDVPDLTREERKARCVWEPALARRCCVVS